MPIAEQNSSDFVWPISVKQTRIDYLLSARLCSCSVLSFSTEKKTTKRAEWKIKHGFCGFSIYMFEHTTIHFLMCFYWIFQSLQPNSPNQAKPSVFNKTAFDVLTCNGVRMLQVHDYEIMYNVHTVAVWLQNNCCHCEESIKSWNMYGWNANKCAFNRKSRWKFCWNVFPIYKYFETCRVYNFSDEFV